MSQPTISMLTAQEMIKDCWGADRPLFLLGSPGMGKTALFESIAKQLDIGFLDIRLTMRDPVDVGGMRVPDLKTGRMVHYTPEDLPVDEKIHGRGGGILLFDEINSVGPMMQATAYGIIQERRSGMKKLLRNWVPMASGNHVGDRAAAQRLSTALANRFNVQYVAPDVASWVKMYGHEHVDARGVAFLKFKPDLFHVMPQADQTAFPTARSWTNAFKFIDKPSAYRRQLFTGEVGLAAADEFEAFWTIMEGAVSIDQILAEPDKATLPATNNPGLCYAVAGMVSAFIDRKNFERIAVYVNRLVPDFQVFIMQGAVKRDPKLESTNAYGGWLAKNQELLT